MTATAAPSMRILPVATAANAAAAEPSATSFSRLNRPCIAALISSSETSTTSSTYFWMMGNVIVCTRRQLQSPSLGLVIVRAFDAQFGPTSSYRFDLRSRCAGRHHDQAGHFESRCGVGDCLAVVSGRYGKHSAFVARPDEFQDPRICSPYFEGMGVLEVF